MKKATGMFLVVTLMLAAAMVLGMSQNPAHAQSTGKTMDALNQRIIAADRQYLDLMQCPYIPYDTNNVLTKTSDYWFRMARQEIDGAKAARGCERVDGARAAIERAEEWLGKLQAVKDARARSKLQSY
jgi:hypothetical protein